MIERNFHTHTSRCGHAVGTDEEYVQAAIQAGLSVLGFSDHAPYKDPEPTERMNIEQVDDYFSCIEALKKKYQDQIEIHVGMEVECYQSEWETLTQWRQRSEYCLLGQHNLSYGGKSSYDLTTKKDLDMYTDQLEYACAHNLCDYIAHPDVCMWSYPVIDESVRQIAQRIADIANTYHIPLELNCGSGVRQGMIKYQDGYRYAYPVRIFFEEFAKKNCDIIIGMDIHDPKLFLTDEYLRRALSVIEGLNCHILDKYDLISEASRRKKLFF